jgi:hypothetical protein
LKGVWQDTTVRKDALKLLEYVLGVIKKISSSAFKQEYLAIVQIIPGLRGQMILFNIPQTRLLHASKLKLAIGIKNLSAGTANFRGSVVAIAHVYNAAVNKGFLENWPAMDSVIAHNQNNLSCRTKHKEMIAIHEA